MSDTQPRKPDGRFDNDPNAGGDDLPALVDPADEWDGGILTGPGKARDPHELAAATPFIDKAKAGRISSRLSDAGVSAGVIGDEETRFESSGGLVVKAAGSRGEATVQGRLKYYSVSRLSRRRMSLRETISRKGLSHMNERARVDFGPDTYYETEEQAADAAIAWCRDGELRPGVGRDHYSDIKGF
jgi:hypothetical protein